MQKVKLIYNPASGEKIIEAHLDNIIAIYQRKGLQIVPYRLRFDSECEEGILFDLDETYHHILIAGGDGTVNHVVNILQRNGLGSIPVGLLPTGTANDFALNIGMSMDIEKSCRRLLASEIAEVDLGIVNGQYFVNVLGVGLFSDLSLKTPTLLKNYFGKFAYYVGGIGELAKLRKLNIKLRSDGGDFEGECYLLLVFNGKTAGSLRIAHSADIRDGKLDVLIVKVGTLETMQTIMHFLSPSTKKKGSGYPAGMVHIQCSELSIESPGNERVDIDGESGPGFPLHIKCAESTLRLMLPQPKQPAMATKRITRTKPHK